MHFDTAVTVLLYPGPYSLNQLRIAEKIVSDRYYVAFKNLYNGIRNTRELENTLLSLYQAKAGSEDFQEEVASTVNRMFHFFDEEAGKQTYAPACHTGR